jgi:hypothetical protein
MIYVLYQSDLFRVPVSRLPFLILHPHFLLYTYVFFQREAEILLWYLIFPAFSSLLFQHSPDPCLSFASHPFHFLFSPPPFPSHFHLTFSLHLGSLCLP